MISITTDTDNAGSSTVTKTIHVDGTAPGLPAFVASTPPANTWTNDNTVFVDWDPATDVGCGVDGYSELWSNSATASPNTTKDREESPTSTTSTPLGGGNWYYKLKTVDNAGNWSSSYAQIGPFRIDIAQPGAVTNLACMSHAPNVWSSDNTLHFVWTGAIDDRSGIAGYAIYYTSGGPGRPGAFRDLDNVAYHLTPPIGSTAGFYFNIRSVDNAGNWDDDYASIGPFNIDVTIPNPPSQLTSTSHTVGTPASDRSVDVIWSTGTDAHSGVAGYSFDWSTSPGATPDAVVETSALLTTSPDLADGDWWFAVLTVDVVGHASTVIRLGPLRIDGTVPTNPTLASTSHAVDVCSPDCTVDVIWSGASGAVALPASTEIAAPAFEEHAPQDIPPSVAGYSIEWSQAGGTVPDQTIDTSGESATSPCLAAGSWWFHLRTADSAGNWSGPVHLGPFIIDTMPPDPVSKVASSTHGVAKWTNAAVVKVVWNAASDLGCGIQGYSVDWSTDPAAVPDQVIETTSTEATSPALADGNAWYVHVRSVDRAGNASAAALVAHLGPFWIDITPPTAILHAPNGGETLNGGSTYDIAFTATDATSGIKTVGVTFSTDSGLTWPTTIVGSGVVPSPVGWGVPQLDVATGRIRVLIKDLAGNVAMDASDADFAIHATALASDGDLAGRKTTTTQAAGSLVFRLGPNVPNPLRGDTVFRYSLPAESAVSLTIYSMSGRRVAQLVSGRKAAGEHSITWDGRDDRGRAVTAGVYIYRLEAGGRQASARMVVMR